MPAAYVNGASPLSWGFIDFLCKPRNISLFLASIFLSATFFLYLSLNLFTDTVSPEGKEELSHNNSGAITIKPSEVSLFLAIYTDSVFTIARW